jgi:hypothetical protein
MLARILAVFLKVSRVLDPRRHVDEQKQQIECVLRESDQRVDMVLVKLRAIDPESQP